MKSMKTIHFKKKLADYSVVPITDVTTTLKGVVQKADYLNKNGIIYPKKILENAIAEYNEVIKNGCAFGEVEWESGSKRSTMINMSNVSHRITKLYLDGDNLVAEAIIVQTEAGKAVKTLVDSKIALKLGLRGFSSLKEFKDGSKEVMNDFKIISVSIRPFSE